MNGKDIMRAGNGLSRRVFLAAGAIVAGGAVLPWRSLPAHAASPVKRIVPSSGEAIPAVGLGTWITFNVGEDQVLRDECAAVMEAFFEAGGTVIDSSPMYGSSQAVVGYGLGKLGKTETGVSADKVWTSSADGGAPQIERARPLWGVPQFDLMQVHHL